MVAIMLTIDFSYPLTILLLPNHKDNIPYFCNDGVIEDAINRLASCHNYGITRSGNTIPVRMFFPMSKSNFSQASIRLICKRIGRIK